MRTCLRCGGEITRGSYCTGCARDRDRERNAAEPWRQVYSSALYRRNRRLRIEQAGGRCEKELPNGRCRLEAVETHHVIALSNAASLEQALSLCRIENLRAVCVPHNPRGGSR